MPPALVALAPVVASVVGGIVKHKQQSSAENKANDFARQQAEQEEAQNRLKFEGAQNSPQAQLQRMGLNSRLASVLGQFGGREQTPGFILNAFDSARGPQEYTPGAEYIDRPGSGAGIWDVVGGAANAASYFDVEGYKNAKNKQGAAQPPPSAAAPPAAAGLAPPSSFRDRDFGLSQPPSPQGPGANPTPFEQQRRNIPGRF